MTSRLKSAANPLVSGWKRIERRNAIAESLCVSFRMAELHFDLLDWSKSRGKRNHTTNASGRMSFSSVRSGAVGGTDCAITELRLKIGCQSPTAETSGRPYRTE